MGGRQSKQIEIEKSVHERACMPAIVCAHVCDSDTEIFSEAQLPAEILK